MTDPSQPIRPLRQAHRERRRYVDSLCGSLSLLSLRSDDGLRAFTQPAGKAADDALAYTGVKTNHRKYVLPFFFRKMAGRPVENGYIESFNGKMRDELPERGSILQPGRRTTERYLWWRDYDQRPYSALLTAHRQSSPRPVAPPRSYPGASSGIRNRSCSIYSLESIT
jgi:hypothetical protein